MHRTEVKVQHPMPFAMRHKGYNTSYPNFVSAKGDYMFGAMRHMLYSFSISVASYMFLIELLEVTELYFGIPPPQKEKD